MIFENYALGKWIKGDGEGTLYLMLLMVKKLEQHLVMV